MTSRTESANTKQNSAAVGEFAPDAQTARIMDVYRSVSDIYRRTEIAMGRVQQYELTARSTSEVKISHDDGGSTAVHHIR